MDDQTLHMLLAEFRSFRDSEWRDFRDNDSAWKQSTGERLAQVETHIKTGITGNGQPSRLKVVEDSVAKLDRFKYWLLGAASGVSSVVSILFRFLEHK